MDALFLDHYEQELSFLREMGSIFAAKYPKLAGQLGLDEFQCADPFVERLLEGFAFMSARIQRKMDAEFPQLTRALLDSVFPHYTRPIPSAGIFQLNPAHDEGTLVNGYRVPRGTRLYSAPAKGQQTGCRFDTTADTTLWPIRIAQFKYHSRESTSSIPIPPSFYSSEIRGVLQLTLETTAAMPFSSMPLDTLRLHFRGREVGHQIHEAMLAHTHSIAMIGSYTQRAPETLVWEPLHVDAVSNPTLAPSESLLPGDHRSFSGFRLLQDYFMLPEKFLFVELNGLQSWLRYNTTNQWTILFGLTSPPTRQIERVSNEHVALHCVPAINLFTKRCDRIHLDHTQHEQVLICDRSRPVDYEIWSIQEMAAHQSVTGQEIPCLPLYAQPSSDAVTEHRSLYYSVDRRPRVLGDPTRFPPRSPYAGSELHVSLTDSLSVPRRQDFQQLSSIAYCTNRDLPLLVPETGWRNAFYADGAAPISNVLCLTGPTNPRNPIVQDDGEAAWRLISHLTPNYLSLVEDEGRGAALLREILHLYCPANDASLLRQMEGILNIRHTSVVRRVPLPGPLTFAQGLEIELQVDEDAFEGGGAFLLCSILEQFFARYVTINCFTETHFVSTKRGSVYRWPPHLGTAPWL